MHRLALTEDIHVTVAILNVVTIRQLVYLDTLLGKVEVCGPGEILCADILRTDRELKTLVLQLTDVVPV